MISVKPFRQAEHKSCQSFNQVNQGSDIVNPLPIWVFCITHRDP